MSEWFLCIHFSGEGIHQRDKGKYVTNFELARLAWTAHQDMKILQEISKSTEAFEPLLDFQSTNSSWREYFLDCLFVISM